MHNSPSQKLHETLHGMIVNAKPGAKLPSEPELAKQLGVARATLREAMRTFETQGMLYRRQGSGTYVAHPSHVIESGLERLDSIETLAERIGLAVTMGELRAARQSASGDEAEALGVTPGADVVHISRVILAEGHPTAFLVDVLPVNVLTPAELETGFNGSVLDLLLRRGTPVLTSSRCEITAAPASHEVARSLGIQRGDVLLRFVAYLYAANGAVVDYSFSYFLPGHFKFHVVRRVG